MTQTIISISLWYLYAGLAVAAIFLTFGLNWLDENARGAWVFRPLLIPGVLLIWPMVLWRWWMMSRGENRLHRHQMPWNIQNRAALIMSLAIPLIIAAAMLGKQDVKDLPPALMLETPE